MADRKSIMCGSVELIPDDEDNSYDLPFSKNMSGYVADWGKGWTWGACVCDIDRYASEHFDTPELAAADLAKFLGEMAEALEPWRAGK